MLPSYLLCFVQITVVSLTAILLSRVTLQRAPRVSARLAALGIALSFAVVVASLVPITRPWRVNFRAIATDSRDRIQSTNEEFDARSSSAPIDDAGRGTQLPSSRSLLRSLRLSLGDESSSPDRPFGPWSWRWIARTALAIAIGVSLLRTVVGLMAIRSLHRSSRPIDASVRRRLQRVVDRIGHAPSYESQAYEVRQTGQIQSPCVTWLKPSVIYVPETFNDWSEDEQAAAIAHELAHVTSRDALHRVGATLCGSPLCFHPMIRALQAQLRIAQELAADQQAAALLGSKQRYLKSLSRIALRLDSQRDSNRPSPTFFVSVSAHDMIKRITMLNSMDGTSTFRQAMAGYASVGVLLGTCLTAICIGDDEPPAVRVAARSTAKVDRPSQDAFTNARTEPWQNLTSGRGYSMFRPSVLAEHEFAQPIVDFFAREIARDAATPDVGLSFANVSLFQARTNVVVKKVPEAQRRDGNNYMLMISADAFDVRTQRLIDWTTVAEKVNFMSLAPETSETVKLVKDWLASGGISDHLLIDSKPDTQIESQVHDAIKEVWSQVDGGTFTLAFATDELFATSMLYKDAATAMSAAEVVGVGLDFGEPNRSVYRIRLAFTPRREYTAKQLIGLLNDARDLAAKMTKEDSSSDPVLSALVKDLPSWTARIESTNVGDVVIVEGPVSHETLASLGGN